MGHPSRRRTSSGTDGSRAGPAWGRNSYQETYSSMESFLTGLQLPARSLLWHSFPTSTAPPCVPPWIHCPFPTPFPWCPHSGSLGRVFVSPCRSPVPVACPWQRCASSATRRDPAAASPVRPFGGSPGDSPGGSPAMPRSPALPSRSCGHCPRPRPALPARSRRSAASPPTAFSPPRRARPRRSGGRAAASASLPSPQMPFAGLLLQFVAALRLPPRRPPLRAAQRAGRAPRPAGLAAAQGCGIPAARSQRAPLPAASPRSIAPLHRPAPRSRAAPAGSAGGGAGAALGLPDSGGNAGLRIIAD
ncbi:uncharacterized protein LOC143692252 [Agelaius phoeniceus]|uniref:uncharacterized protein LOC143692252 n=1 Tax=Agelaius phoeniceus TaxID=39638 RepID=UPI004054B503